MHRDRRSFPARRVSVCPVVAPLLTPLLALLFGLGGCEEDPRIRSNRGAPLPVVEAVLPAVKPSPTAHRERSQPNSTRGTRLEASPRVPVAVWASRTGAQTPGAAVSITFTVEPHMPIVQLRTEVRGVRGVIVGSGATLDHKLKVAAGKVRAVQRVVNVRADAGVAGFVAVDLQWYGPDGDGSVTLAVPVSAKGGVLSLEEMGRQEVEADGRRVLVTPAEVR